MATFWIDAKTGELLADYIEGAEEFHIPPEEISGEPDEAWLRPWYLREMRRLQVSIADTKAQAKEMISSLETQTKGLKWRWGERFKVLVKADLDAQKGKRKSVIYLEGTAGWFKNNSIDVCNPALAIEWLREHCPDALNYKDPTVIKASLPKGEAIPGVNWPEGDKFFVRFPKDKKGED